MSSLRSPSRSSRRNVLAGAAGLGLGLAIGAVGGAPGRAHAALVLGPDPVRSYELAWERIDTTVDDNEGGSLAWGMSYILLSLMRMYQATGDTRYLDRFVERADQVWAQTDIRRGVTDFAGRSGWVWRAGGNYTAAGAVVRDTAGTPLFEVRYAGSDGATASVTVSGAGAGLADLELTHPTSNSFTVPGVSFDPASPDFVVTRINEGVYHPWYRWTAKWLDGSPDSTPVESTVPLEQRYYAFAVHTGMVTYPMALFTRVVLAEHLARHRGAAQRYLARIRKAVAYHDAEWHWRQLPDGSTGGDYVWPKGVPVPFDGLIQPFNQTQGLGLTMAELHRVTRIPAMAARVEAMVRAFRSDMEDDGAAWQWRYWPTYSELFRSYTADQELSEYTPWYTSASQYEDVSHAAISVEFMTAAHRSGLGSTDGDLARLVATYRDNVRLDDTRVNTRVDGSTPSTESIAAQTGRWLGLQPWGPDLAPHVRAVYEAMELEPGSGSHLAGVGYLAWALNDGWQRD